MHFGSGIQAEDVLKLESCPSDRNRARVKRPGTINVKIMEEVIMNVLYRTSRPGYKAEQVDAGQKDDNEPYPSDAQWSWLHDRMTWRTPDEAERRLELAQKS